MALAPACRNAGVEAIDDLALQRHGPFDVPWGEQRGNKRIIEHLSGVLYWLGLCQILMVNIAEDNLDRPAALRRLSDMLMLGLSGLGILLATAAAVTTRVVDRCASAKAP